MTPTPKLASGAVARTAAGDAGTAVAGAAAAAGAAEPGPFVLNLCSSTTPMALEQTQIPELKRFAFFVSRRREEGRERFRLHMGYFATLEEAQEWLNVVRDIYPGAWAGETPGKKLRERAAQAATQAQHARGSQLPAAAAPQNPVRTTVQTGEPTNRAVAAAAANAAAQQATQARAPINVPTLQAAAPVVNPASLPVAKPVSAPASPRVQPSVRVQATAPAVRSPVPNAAAAAAVAAARAAVLSSAPRAAAPPKSPAQAPKAPSVPAAARAVAPSRVAVPPAASRAPAAGVSATARPQQTAPRSPTPPAPAAGPARLAAKPAVARPTGKVTNKASLPSSNVREVLAALDEKTGETRMMPSPVIPNVAPPSDDAALTDTQVLRFLETRRDEETARSEEEGESGSISLLKPDDTGTRRALKEAVVRNAPVSFAVQLQWSVQPVELDKVPPLAIFSAYRLYTVEGSRDGRKWYGLRLGFFTDAISAKQVAYYVRSEFASVAVVPVSPQERTRASEDDKKAAGLAFPKRARQEPVDEFKLIDTEEAPVVSAPPARPAAAAQPGPAAKASHASNKRGNRVRAREHRSPQTLEETLEILGASQLEIDNGNGETLNESGVRHLRVEVQKNTPFRRLIERLSERTRKG
jgi:hypothetical protein